MKSRGLVVVLALVLATLATAGVFLYARGVKQNAEGGGTKTNVVVSKVDIAANTDLSTLIDSGQFELKAVPNEDVVTGAITAVSDLRGRRNSVPILAGEQIPLARVQGGKVTGGTLGIDEGYQALTVALDAPAAVAGAFAAGDFITVYATFTDVPVKQKKPQQPATTAGGQQQAQQTETATVVLVPQVKVLRVAVPQSQSGGVQVSQTSGTITIALEFLPVDAQKFVFAVDQGTVYLSLLPPNGKGTELPPLTVTEIVGGAKKAK
jgi:Flp pilus assembly protein CpaB